jgi:hypothetical protein
MIILGTGIHWGGRGTIWMNNHKVSHTAVDQLIEPVGPGTPLYCAPSVSLAVENNTFYGIVLF